MKRFLLSSLLLLAAGRVALGFENNQTVIVPPGNPQDIVLDDPVFINNSWFQLDMTTLQNVFGGTAIYTTSDTLYYTNNGVLIGVPGFDFETFPASVGQATPAVSFVNTAGSTIAVTNIYAGLNPFNSGNILAVLGGPINFELPGLAQFKVRATNITDAGLITMDSTGLIDLSGKDVNLDHANFQMTGAGSLNVLDYGGGGFGTNSGFWSPIVDLQPTFAISPIFTNFAGVIEQMAVGVFKPATPYFENLNPAPGPDGIKVWRVIYLEDNSPTNVSANVFFGNSPAGSGAFHIQWAGTFRNPFTGGTDTNFFALSDVPEIRRGPTYFLFPNLIPAEFTFAQSLNQPLLAGAPATPGFIADPFNIAAVTNDFGFLSVQPVPVSVGTNQIIGGSPTNLPGRVQLTSSDTMTLANTHILGANYLSVSAPVNYLGNSNSMIEVPFSDLNLGSSSGFLILSNLLVPDLPGWTGVSGAPSGFGFFGSPQGGIQAFSGSYFFIDGAGVTNDVRLLMVASALQPTFPSLTKDLFLHAANGVIIGDKLNIFNKFFSDTAALTVRTNANSAYSLDGELHLLSQDILWSTSFPNLQYFTNQGQVSTTNLANFADNMPTVFSPRSSAVAYQAFVNQGTINNRGAFVLANEFDNSGQMQEFLNGDLDISASTVNHTNGTLAATNGSVSITGNSLLLSNSVITAGRALKLAASCSLSDGYVLSNMFGHATNALLPVVVTNGNFFTAGAGTGGGVRVTLKPPTADLLGTTITNMATNSLNSINQWAGEDRGVSPAGFADNLALGRMIFISDKNPSQFTFMPVGGNNALYVDTLDFRGGATNTDANGNYTAFNIQPGMKIYYAQALAGGASIAEKLNGKNGGGFLWVSNYAGIYSSTNLLYPDGNTYIFNEALVISPDIDTDGNGTVNRDDATPIPVGLTFDNSPVGPQPCGGGSGGGGNGGTGGNGGGGAHPAPGTLAFPAHQTGGGSTGVSFALAAGNYNGLFYDTNGVNPASSGFFTAKVTGRGSFSAKLQLGAQTYSASGLFNAQGNCTTFATAKGQAPLTLTLQLVNNNEITGQVSGNGWTAQLLAVDKARAMGAGKHSLVLAVDNQGSTTPSGDSFGTMNLNKSGDIQWTGVLPDGVKVSQKSALSKDGVWPMYSSLYGGSGTLIGWLQLTNGNADIGGSAVWVVPANQNGLYPDGLTNQLNATGMPLTTSAAFSASTVVLTGPQLTSPLTNSVIISGKTGQSPDHSLSLSLDTRNGLFSGSAFDANSGQTLSFQGALLEKSGTGGGFFLNADKDQGGKVYLAPAN